MFQNAARTIFKPSIRKKFSALIIIVLTTIPLLVISQITHTVNFSSENLSFTDEVAANNNTYTKVKLFDFDLVSDTGKPALPVKSIKLIIPHGQTVDNISF